MFLEEVGGSVKEEVGLEVDFEEEEEELQLLLYGWEVEGVEEDGRGKLWLIKVKNEWKKKSFGLLFLQLLILFVYFFLEEVLWLLFLLEFVVLGLGFLVMEESFLLVFFNVVFFEVFSEELEVKFWFIIFMLYVVLWFGKVVFNQEYMFCQQVFEYFVQKGLIWKELVFFMELMGLEDGGVSSGIGCVEIKVWVVEGQVLFIFFKLKMEIKKSWCYFLGWLFIWFLLLVVKQEVLSDEEVFFFFGEEDVSDFEVLRLLLFLQWKNRVVSFQVERKFNVVVVCMEFYCVICMFFYFYCQVLQIEKEVFIVFFGEGFLVILFFKSGQKI